MENQKLKISPFSREFPPGCGISSSLSQVNFRALRSVNHHYIREFPPGCGPNAVNETLICPERNLGRDNVSDWRRPISAVKKPPQKLKEKEEVGVSNERKRVLEMLSLFRKRCDEISRRGDKSIHRVDIEANKELTDERKITHQSSKVIGAIPGVEIGDKFYYRVELRIVGLQRLPQGGIDQMEYRNDKIATCIVANEGHMDKMNDSNVLTYIGEGGNPKKNETVAPDQELKKGNRALWVSMKEKKPVRVVRGLKFDTKTVYVYDGLYEVKNYEKKIGPQGNMIFEFSMVRCPGQPVVNWRQVTWNH